MGSAQAPVVTGTEPARHTAVLGAQTGIKLQFSQPITAASAGNLRVFGTLRQGRRAGTVTGGGTSTLTFSPSHPFAPGEQVRVSVPASVQNAAGSGVARQVLEFTAAAGGTGRGTFTGGSEVEVGTWPTDIVTGDVDGDGDLDFVTVHDYLFRAAVGFNNGDGTYTLAPYNTIVGGHPTSVALGDVDGDGDLDMLVTDAQDAGQGGGAGSVSICTNDGKGQFLDTVFGAQSQVVGIRPSSVAVGDVDADGDLDFVAANEGSNSVSIRLNNGAGTFGGSGTVAVGALPTKVVLGDIDNDGDLDLLTANADDNTVSVRLNAGNGSFSGTTTVSVGATPEDVVLADLDGNGSLDFATINYKNPSVSVRLNTGTGTFGSLQSLPLPEAGSALTLGDIDADGDTDLLAAGQKTVTVFLNNGRAVFTAVVPVAIGSAPTGLALADVDADGDLDLLASNENGGTVSVRLNGVLRPPSITSFTPSSGRIGATVVLTGEGFWATTQVRFNGIPAPNFAVASDTRLTVTVPAGATSGPLMVTTPLGTTTSAASFVVQVPPVVTAVAPARNTVAADRGTAPQITFSEPMTAASADNVRVFSSLLRGRQAGTVTGGGSATLTFSPAQRFAPGELVSVSVPATVEGPSGGVTPHVFQFRAAVTGASGQANFTGTQNIGVGGECWGVTVGDVDNDGDLDMVATKTSGATVTLRLNDGTGNFPASREIPTDVFSQQALLSDLDADGDLDLLVSSSSTGKISLRLNDGRGNFSGTTALVGGEFLAVGDIDADGDQDILSADSGPGVNIFFNNGNATFTTGTYAGLDDALGLALADVDNDGDLDVVTTHGSISKFAKIGLNDGRGSFTAGPAVAVGAAATAVALADLDGDQDVDLVTVHRAAGRVHIQYNNGSGQFGGLQAVLVGPDPTALELADVDADGDLDLVVPNYLKQLTSPNTVSVRLNDGHGGFVPAPSAIVTPNDAAYQIALGDLDNDGDLDLLTANAYGNSVSVRFNQPTPAPVVNQVSPARGPVGSLVLLTGSNFVGARQVRFNGQSASYYTINSATQITVRVPAAATTGFITVVSPAGTGTSTQAFTVTQPVAVTSLNPTRNSHTAPGGSSVALTFAQPMQTATATELRVFGNQRQGLRSGSLSGDGTSTVSFMPSLPFAPGEQVTVVVPNTLQGSAGSAVQQVYQFRAATSGSGTGNFVAAPSVPVGQLPLSIALGDVDGDGDLDMVSGNARSQTLSIRRNNGQGTFSGTQEIRMPMGLGQIKLADLDNDQDLDIVIPICHCSWGGTLGEVAIQLNDGAGNFKAATAIPVPGRLYGVDAGDVDNDGDLDLVLSNYSRDSVYVRLNDGQARFSGTHAVAVGTQPKTLVLGDVDNDGDLDLVVANVSDSYTDRPNVVSVRLNNGLGFFSGTQDVLVSGRPQNVTLGDVDNDGDLDLVASTDNYQDKGVCIGLNNGQGGFSTLQTVAVGRQPEAVLLGDIDADGDLDLLTANVSSNTSSVRLNDGHGVFSVAQEIPVGSGPWEMALGDIDADGDLDLVSVDDQLNEGFVNVFLNSLPAPVISSFTPTTGEAGTVVTLTGRFFTGTSQVTFNGVAASFTVVSATQLTATVPATATTGSIKVTTPYGKAVSTTPFVLPAPAIASFSPMVGGPGLVITLRGNYFTGATGVNFGTVAASFTLVSATEATAVVPEGATTATIRLTSPSGTGTSASPFTVLAAPVATTWAPGLNASHVPATSPIEVSFSRAISVASASSLRVFGNQRQGQRTGTLTGGGTAALRFVPARPFAPGEQISVSLPPTLLGAEGGQMVKRVFQFRAAASGSGRGTFAGPTNLLLKLSVNTLRLGDMDGDGDLDAVTSSGYNQLGVALNQGNGTFATPLYTPNPVVSANPALQLGDFDGDGDLDVATYYNFGTVAIRMNDGHGGLSGSQNVAAPGFGGGAYREIPLEVGDLDADGDLDLVTGSPNQGSITALLNDGHGVFSPGPQQLLAVYFTIFRLGDVDNDGDLDLVAIRESDADPERRVLSILLNNGDGLFTATARLPLPTVPTGLKLADMDRDGTLDAVITDYEDLPGADHWGLTVLRNNGAARFTVGARRALPASGAVANVLELGDVDADGDVDALTAGFDYRSSAQFIRLFLNNGQGTLSSVTALPITSTPVTLQLADLDGDGDLDLATDIILDDYYGLAARLNNPGVPLSATAGSPLLASVVLYPNPAHQQFTLQLPAGLLLRPGTLSLVNSLGQVMYTQVLAAAPAGHRIQIEVPGLATGLYLVRLNIEGSQQPIGHLMIE